MRIAVASGKGGTGKTTVATNVAMALRKRGEDTCYIDCDVEEPNGHIFLKPLILNRESVGILVPEVDEEKCTGCGLCGQICQYSAIIVIEKQVLIFPELCHGCGGCSLVCPEGAIGEVSRQIGVIETGEVDGLSFVQGRLNVGEAQSPPLIRQVKKHLPRDGVVLLDAPPGTSCPVIEVVNGTDFVLLVTEPTPFGLNDLKLAVEMTRKLQLPHGVIINRSDVGDKGVELYCQAERIQVFMRIPDDRRIAEAYSRGEMVIETLPEYRERFVELFNRIREAVNR